jgi:hypothetical protein
MSSFLEPGAAPWGEVKGRVEVDVVTIDEYCEQHGITHIDVLKSDTQGFDLEVVRGADSMLSESRVHLVFCEINFNEAYAELPRLDEIYAALHDRGLRLVSFYNFHYLPDRVSWADALFIAPGYRAER